MNKPKISKIINQGNINDTTNFSSCEFTNDKLLNDIIDAEFDSCIFKNIDFSKCKITCKSITDCIFENCIIPNLSINEFLGRCIFKNCKLIGLNINNVFKINDILFENCNLDYSVIADTTVNNIKFNSCSIKETSFFNLLHKNLEFDSCDLSLSEFYNFKFINLDLRTCDLHEIKFRIQDIYGAQLSITQLMDIAPQLGIVIK